MGHANAEAVMLTAANGQDLARALDAATKAGQDAMPGGLAAFVLAPFAAINHGDADHRQSVPLTAVQAARAAVPRGPAPAHVPLAGFEPKDKLALPIGNHEIRAGDDFPRHATGYCPDDRTGADAAPWLHTLSPIRSP